MSSSRCESCGRIATVRLIDGSAWCDPCDEAARNLGYDDERGERISEGVSYE